MAHMFPSGSCFFFFFLLKFFFVLSPENGHREQGQRDKLSGGALDRRFQRNSALLQTEAEGHLWSSNSSSTSSCSCSSPPPPPPPPRMKLSVRY